MPLFDTHAHYDSRQFDADRDALLASMPENGVGLIVNPGCDLPSSRTALELARRYPHVRAAVGIHPEDCAEFSDDDINALRDLCAAPEVVAVGEIGLDYYWKDNPPKELQKLVFRKQIELALELDLPVIIHDRDAHGDCLDIVREYPELTGVFHCFSGSAEMASELLRRGWYLGFDGPITYRNAKRAAEVIALAPPDRIVIETDSPYLTPVPKRGQRNDSRNLTFIVERFAEWKGLSPDEAREITWENGKRLYRIP